MIRNLFNSDSQCVFTVFRAKTLSDWNAAPSPSLIVAYIWQMPIFREQHAPFFRSRCRCQLTSTTSGGDGLNSDTYSHLIRLKSNDPRFTLFWDTIDFKHWDNVKKADDIYGCPSQLDMHQPHLLHLIRIYF